jgi:hypothetical protein
MSDLDNVQLIVGIIALFGVPIIASNEEARNYGFLHGQGKLIYLVFGNFILLILTMFMISGWGYWIWLALNLGALAAYFYQKYK